MKAIHVTEIIPDSVPTKAAMNIRGMGTTTGVRIDVPTPSRSRSANRGLATVTFLTWGEERDFPDVLIHFPYLVTVGSYVIFNEDASLRPAQYGEDGIIEEGSLGIVRQVGWSQGVLRSIIVERPE